MFTCVLYGVLYCIVLNNWYCLQRTYIFRYAHELKGYAEISVYLGLFNSKYINVRRRRVFWVRV